MNNRRKREFTPQVQMDMEPLIGIEYLVSVPVILKYKIVISRYTYDDKEDLSRTYHLLEARSYAFSNTLRSFVWK